MFRSILKEKELFDRELDLYKRERQLAVEKEIEDYRTKRNGELQELALRCTKELGEYEHTYHSTKEAKGIALANIQAQVDKLDAKREALSLVIDARVETTQADNNLLKSKDAEIKRLNDIITLFINKQPQHTTTLQQLK